MIKINYKILVTGMICLTIIFMTLIIYDHDNGFLQYVIIGVISLVMGVIIPTPKVDNRRGLLIW